MNVIPMGSHTAYRDGDLLLVHDGSALPDRCPVCNAPAATGLLTLRFAKSRRHRRAHPVAALIGRIFDRFSDWRAGDHYTGPIIVQARLCPVHAGQQRWLYASGWGMVIGGCVGFLLTVAGCVDPWALFPCLLALLAGVPVTLGMGFGVLQFFLLSQRFDDRWVWLRGACPEFLASLPEAPGPKTDEL